MSRLGGWLRGSKATSTTNGDAAQAAIRDVSQDMESAMTAAALIMSDDVDGADKLLLSKDSAFHLLGRGLTAVMRSMLGFEQEVMKEAADRLHAAENKAWEDMKRAQKNNIRTSQIYSPGSEFALSYAQAQLMNAVVAVLSENLTESLKGFYKMRKAYQTLDQLMQEEDRYFKRIEAEGSNQGSGWSTPAGHATSTSVSSVTLDSITNQKIESKASDRIEDDDSDLEFVDADESHSGMQTPADYTGHLTTANGHETAETKLSSGVSGLSLGDIDGQSHESLKNMPLGGSNVERDASLFNTTIDAFIHSGINLCFGMMLVILSMVPPSFGRLLSVIGFRGDRERGLTLLWQSCPFPNIYGAVSGLMLLNYYNSIGGFCDILPDTQKYPDDILGYPRQRCEALLTDMRSRYPKSSLWRLEEGRMHASKKNLSEAIAILNSNTGSQMKQISALNMFEKSLNCMFAHEYLECATGFEECMKLNSWSHCLYTYIMACCHIELYRDARTKDAAEAAKWKKSAIKLLKDAPTHAGKKKFMAKQLPFDVYVNRKITKWEERAKAWHCDVVDAVGVSPLEEMIYLWNGSRRMPPTDLEKSLSKLSWDEVTFPEKHIDNHDESGLRALLQSTILRHQNKYAGARAVLQEGILQHDRALFKGHLKDDWACPAGYYEMAAIAWAEKNQPGVNERALVLECEEWLSKASNWDSYTLDARIGMKITTSLDTIHRYKDKAQ